MKSEIILGLSGAAFFLACATSSESTTEKSGVYSGKEILIESRDSQSGVGQSVRIIDGDSLIFLHSSYTDAGEEGWGSNTCFTIPEGADSSHFSDSGTARLVIAYGTGFAPGFSDTIKSYDFIVFRKGDAFLIRGKIGNLNVSGTFKPIPGSTNR